MVEIAKMNNKGEITQSVVVKQSELGVNCWLPARFLGGKCQRYKRCKYPEKVACKAH